MISLPTFEELYVISDLHLGGTRGTPIFDQEEALAGLIKHLAGRDAPGGGVLALLLNGDVIDTLAEEIDGYVAAPLRAETALSDIFERFPSIETSLRAFVNRPQHRLVIVIGNHDLELAYPNVQEMLIERLAKQDEVLELDNPNVREMRVERLARQEACRGRIVFVTTGAGFRCQVGRAGAGFATALCVHGNEYDDWNAVSPESMTRIVRASVLGADSKLTGEHPNAGTKLVKDVMNGIKVNWPFVDLLKPEIDSVFNVLLAVDPRRITALVGVIQALQHAVTEGVYRTQRVLGAPAGGSGAPAQATWQPGTELEKVIGAATGASLSLDEAWQQAADGVSGEALADSDEVLGAGRLVLNLLNYSARRLIDSPRDALRAALLDWGGGQEVWQLDGQCDVYDRLAKLAVDAHVVIAGHTHLRRQKRFAQRHRGEDGALYLNTGTWARLLRLTTELLLRKDMFDKLWDALQSMPAIDLLSPDVLLKEPTVAVIRVKDDGASVQAALCEFKPRPGAPPGSDPIALVPDARWEQVG